MYKQIIFKRILILLIVIQNFALPYNSFCQNRAKLIVKVIDKKTNLAVDNAKIQITKIAPNYIDFYKETRFTNSNGEVLFKLSKKTTEFEYGITTKKENFYPYFNLQTQIREDNKNNITINWGKKNIIELYLYSDEQNAIKFNALLHPRVPIKTVIVFLKSNKYDVLKKNYKTTFPYLIWEDIPELLKIGNSTIIINKFPINVISSSITSECQLGIIALWMIESIRRCDGKLPLFCSLYPSSNPVLKGHIPDSYDMLTIAYEAYRKWWEDTKTMNRDKATKINPLENTGLKW